MNVANKKNLKKFIDAIGLKAIFVLPMINSRSRFNDWMYSPFILLPSPLFVSGNSAITSLGQNAACLSESHWQGLIHVPSKDWVYSIEEIGQLMGGN